MTPNVERIAPSFLVIGAGKAGTTWIYRLLKMHPQVFLASAKETLYFADEFRRGPAWYAGFFKDSGRANAAGEVSNTYIFYPDTPRRIHDHNPDMKLVASLRNPIDRALSHYVLMLRNAQERGTFEDVLERHPELLERGLYAKHLSEYLRLFAREQLLVLLFDDLKRDSRSFAASICAFLAIDPLFPESAAERALPASKPRSRAVAYVVKRVALGVRRLGFPSLVNQVKESRLPSLLYQPLKDDEYPVIAPETRARLRAYFHDDVRALSDIVGRDMVAQWSM